MFAVMYNNCIVVESKKYNKNVNGQQEEEQQQEQYCQPVQKIFFSK